MSGFSGGGTTGQQSSADSVSVTIASDQSPVPTTGTQEITDGLNTVAVVPGMSVPDAEDPSLLVILSPNQLPIPVTVAAGTSVTSTGDITNTQNVAIDTSSSGTAGITISGTWSGTLVFEATVNNVSWVSVNAKVPSTGVEVTQTTANGTWTAAVASFQQFRVRGNTVSSGTATIFLDSVTGQQVVSLTGSLPAGSNTIGLVDQGVSSSLPGAWAVKLTDGTNTAPTMDVVARAGFQHITDGTNTATITTEGSHKALDVQIYHGGTVKDPTQIRALTSSDNITSSQGAASALSGAWPIKLTDGSNTSPTMDVAARAGYQHITDGTNSAAVKADSTQAIASDPALVVSLSPNSPLPTGTNAIGTVTTVQDTASNLHVLATQGTAAAASGAWTNKITDGTNIAAVKAPSTAAIATDPALVVTISPNNAVITNSLSVNTVGAAIPASATLLGASDGTNIQALRIFDVDSGAGTQYVLGTQLRKSSSGGSVEAGTATDPIRIDPIGSTTQPVSGTVTANVGTTNGLALDSTLTGGTVKSISRGGAKGATTAADVTSTAQGTDHQAIDVQIYHGGAAKDPTQIRALTSSDVVTAVQGTAAAASGAWTVKVTDGTNTAPTMDIASRAGYHRITDGTNSAAVKAASTPAGASDPALVASLSPNSPLPTGTNAIGTVTAVQDTASNLNVLASQGTASNASGAWMNKITDGTNVAAVKAASTPAGATDPAIVVAISPNNSITTTSLSTAITGGTLPSSATLLGASDGTNIQAARIFDADSGGGTQYVLGTQLRKSSSGGSVEAGTLTDPLRIDPTGSTTQPVSGTVTSNIGTTNGLALDATLTGGTTKAISRGGAKGATSAADITSTAEGADHQALDIQIYHGGTAKDPTQVRALTSSDVVTAVQGTAAAASGAWTAKITDGTNIATVLAASTKSAKTDPALVVALSSNNNGVTFGDSASVDAFSRLRISQPDTIFGSKLLVDNQPLSWDDQQVSGGSTTSTYNSAQASVTLLANSSVAGRRLRQTFKRFNYQPGKSQLILMTGVLATTGSGNAAITRRIGYYDDNNGFYFDYNGSTLNTGIRTSTSGSPVSTLTAQTNWNIDKFNGSGASGLTLDVTKAQIFVIDFQWLGVGRIRYGFDINGSLYYCHEVKPANNQNIVSIANPNLPLRYEIISDGTGANSSATMTQICATVASEAGVDTIGIPFSADVGTTVLTTGNNTNNYCLLAIQLQSTKLNSYVVPYEFTVSTATANAQYRISLVLNPSVAGTALSFSAVTNSSVQSAVGVANNLVTGGTVLYSGYFQSNKTGSISERLANEFQLGSTIAGVGDILVLCVQPVPAGATAFVGSISWRESF